MGTTEEQIIYLAQQMNAMQTDVAEPQNAPHGSATRYAKLVVQLVISEPKVRGVVEADDEATAGMSRLQALVTRSICAMTSVAQRFRGKGVTEYKPHVWSGERSSESFTAFKMELQNWDGYLNDDMMKAMEVAEADEGRLLELDVRNVTRNSGRRQRLGEETIPGAHCMHQGRSEKNDVCNP